ncbi:hypothetical protein HMPREF3156_02159 [Neisseria sp. HMSC06F02]|nr:hypothetical protein HMPREF3156_02159 [Neisseria sp. HMSC06F02]
MDILEEAEQESKSLTIGKVCHLERSSENFQTTFLGRLKIFRRPFA